MAKAMPRRWVAVTVAALAALCVADALRLPTYMKACRKNDPNLNECALKNGREAIPKFVNGDRKYRIPNLAPLTLYNFNVDTGSSSVGIKLHVNEAKIHGLGDADIKAIAIDLPGRHVSLDLVIPVLNILGDYQVSGKVLVLPITGHGPANITVNDVVVNFSFDYELITKKKTGKEHVNLTTSTVQFDIGRGYFSLQNLFNGDKLLGDNMNVFLNENSKEVVKGVGPSLADTIGEVIRQILQQITDLVPFDNLFLPE